MIKPEDLKKFVGKEVYFAEYEYPLEDFAVSLRKPKKAFVQFASDEREPFARCRFCRNGEDTFDYFDYLELFATEENASEECARMNARTINGLKEIIKALQETNEKLREGEK